MSLPAMTTAPDLDFATGLAHQTSPQLRRELPTELAFGLCNASFLYWEPHEFRRA